jgi:hypothetical protein
LFAVGILRARDRTGFVSTVSLHPRAPVRGPASGGLRLARWLLLAGTNYTRLLASMGLYLQTVRMGCRQKAVHWRRFGAGKARCRIGSNSAATRQQFWCIVLAWLQPAKHYLSTNQRRVAYPSRHCQRACIAGLRADGALQIMEGGGLLSLRQQVRVTAVMPGSRRRWLRNLWHADRRCRSTPASLRPQPSRTLPVPKACSQGLSRPTLPRCAGCIAG